MAFCFPQYFKRKMYKYRKGQVFFVMVCSYEMWIYQFTISTIGQITHICLSLKKGQYTCTYVIEKEHYMSVIDKGQYNYVHHWKRGNYISTIQKGQYMSINEKWQYICSPSLKKTTQFMPGIEKGHYMCITEKRTIYVNHWKRTIYVHH